MAVIRSITDALEFKKCTLNFCKSSAITSLVVNVLLILTLVTEPLVGVKMDVCKTQNQYFYTAGNKL